ncbi:hypothetical protein CF54_04070 [Streptomyces sp. Tu 6176]|uniref:hypothetical protein n=1 Tax=Streptomyces sp. Tu 6176 TaxID=1470557 RepID=UPI00044F1DBE|nr:hypothetical protein [Streptomyces sp. Tu 6176]EYT83987.1 hypothetical protein CF54_04070 [Streptomyces sp. Tu 6176]
MENEIIRPGYLTAHQTARILGITLDGVRQLVRRRRLARAGGTPRQPWYRVTDVTKLAADRQTNHAA